MFREIPPWDSAKPQVFISSNFLLSKINKVAFSLSFRKQKTAALRGSAQNSVACTCADFYLLSLQCGWGLPHYLQIEKIWDRGKKKSSLAAVDSYHPASTYSFFSQMNGTMNSLNVMKISAKFRFPFWNFQKVLLHITFYFFYQCPSTVPVWASVRMTLVSILGLKSKLKLCICNHTELFSH